MESLDEMTKTSSAKEGFFKHVFNMDEESKGDILNIIQYSILAIIPIVLLNKFMQYYIPETEDNKGNVELSVEVILQVLIIFLGLLLIHRLITYIPTYSGLVYDKFSVTNIILAVLIIVLSLQTKLGDKVNVLIDRLLDYMDGNKGKSESKKKKQKSQKSQPVQDDNQENTTSIHQLPVSNSMSAPPPAPQSLAQQTNTDFNAMFAQQNNPLVNASSPSADGMSYENFGPMAANEALAGGFGGSSW